MKIIFFIPLKSIPKPFSEIIFIIPSNNIVVASPSIFGPTMLNIVERIANIITITIAILYLPKYFNNFLRVPLKSFGFSPGIATLFLPPPIGPLLCLLSIVYSFLNYSLFIINSSLFIKCLFLVSVPK